MFRKLKPVNLTLKELTDGGIFEGYASVFGVVDSDGDVIVKGAFKESLEAHKAKGKMPKLLWMHNPTIIIGKIIELYEDEKGLYLKGQLILEVEKGREAYALLKAGELDAMSVGFNVSGEVTASAGGGIVISKADLWEVSLVTWGANPEAEVLNVKTIKTKRDFERFLRDSGFSKAQAVSISSTGFNANEGSQSDSGQSEALIKGIDNLINKLKGDQNGIKFQTSGNGRSV